MASIKTDNGLEGMRSNSEATVAHLLPYDPVTKKRSGGQKRGSAQISSLLLPPQRNQILGKHDFIFVTTRLVNTGT